MTKHYSQKDNLITIMTEISKKTPRGIMNSDTQVGHITWQMYLMRDYLKLDGTPLANASNDYSDLLFFAQDNNLITNDTTDNSLFKYDSTTDVLTLPNYIDLVLQGGNTVEEKEAGLPNIRSSRLYAFEHNIEAMGGAFTKELVSAQNKFPTLSDLRMLTDNYELHTLVSKDGAYVSEIINRTTNEIAECPEGKL